MTNRHFAYDDIAGIFVRNQYFMWTNCHGNLAIHAKKSNARYVHIAILQIMVDKIRHNVYNKESVT